MAEITIKFRDEGNVRARRFLISWQWLRSFGAQAETMTHEQAEALLRMFYTLPEDFYINCVRLDFDRMMFEVIGSSKQFRPITDGETIPLHEDEEKKGENHDKVENRDGIESAG